ncbi:YkgJ family cysteine cluster protein [Acinetobacter gyllenbergii]|uniref:YkgJ family cysteine cluster protein n=1 Tax=Acinetobacter gyllenbergii TaxID=134534 RepID=UPI003AF7C3F2
MTGMIRTGMGGRFIQYFASELTAYLDRGDGVCHYYDLDTRLCGIYENRPEICRVDDYYKKYLKERYVWDDFIDLNLIVCKQLNELD